MRRITATAGAIASNSLLSQHGIEGRQTATAGTPMARRRAREVRRALAEEPGLRGMLSHPKMSAQEEIALGRLIQQAQRMRADLDAHTVEDGPEARHVLPAWRDARTMRPSPPCEIQATPRIHAPGGAASRRHRHPSAG